MDEKQRNVKVVCRFRPLNQKQRAISNSMIQQVLDDKTVMIKQNKIDKGNNQQNPKFSFDKVFDSQSTQSEVYNYAASSVIESVIEGFNGTIFAYGQTSSGKTHTMEGQISHQLTQNSGIIPRMVRQVFDSINKSSENVQFRIKVSIVQLYMEKLRDLMDSNRIDLKIRSDKKKGIFIQGLTEVYISTAQEVYELMQTAGKNRAIASTNMNQRSSRSHMLFILTISQNNMDDLSAKTGKLYLVDLAGSQKVGKTGAQGKVLDEAKKINISLTALGKVIHALTDGRSTHVPYRDSKLTRVLQESLGGNSKTSLIVTCSPHANNTAETLSTLRFGVSAKKIKNKPKINKQMTVAELQNMLQKTEKQLEERISYIDQLKTYITTDLKVKRIPQFSGDSKHSRGEQQIDLITQLERQLEIQRNFSVVQGQQLANYKDKYDKLYSQKQIIQSQLASIKEHQRQKNKLLSPKNKINKSISNSLSTGQIKAQIQSQDPSTIQGSSNAIDQFLQELASITSDPNVIKLFKDKLPYMSSVNPSNCYSQLLEQQQKRQQAEDKMQKYEKTMQKKLNQLQNNICQLTHAYYDLLIIQQRHKVDNIFMKKKVDEKDLLVQSMKRKIKDLEDINRQLQQRGWDDQQKPTKQGSSEFQSEKRSFSKYLPSLEQHDKLEELLRQKSGVNNQSHQAPRVVKVVRGGNK